MTCTTSPCTISGLDPCVEYTLSAIPTNNCGSPTGCTGSMVATKGYNQSVLYCIIPLCTNVNVYVGVGVLQYNVHVSTASWPYCFCIIQTPG